MNGTSDSIFYDDRVMIVFTNLEGSGAQIISYPLEKK